MSYSKELEKKKIAREWKWNKKEIKTSWKKYGLKKEENVKSEYKNKY